MKSIQDLQEELLRFGKMLHQQGYVSGTDGNLSARLDAQHVIASPTGFSKGMMSADDLVVVDLRGRKVQGKREVSTEITMHLTVYGMRPDIGAVIHAHPYTATGFAAAGVSLDQPLCSEVVVALGAIPLARYETPGTPELSESLKPFISDYDAILMANHGVVSYGEDLLHAYLKMEAVEHFAKITLVTHQLGSQQLLSDEQIQKLVEARSRYAGNTSMARMPARLIRDIK